MTGRNCFKLKGLDVGRKFFTQRAVRHWHWLPRGAVDASSLEVLKGPWAAWCVGWQLCQWQGAWNWGIFKVPSNKPFYISVIHMILWNWYIEFVTQFCKFLLRSEEEHCVLKSNLRCIKILSVMCTQLCHCCWKEISRWKGYRDHRYWQVGRTLDICFSPDLHVMFMLLLEIWEVQMKTDADEWS